MRLLKMLLHALCGVTLVYYCVLVTAGMIVQPRSADVAVVLGNEVLANGKPSDRLMARVDAAIALYREGKVKKILVSGGKGPNGFDEATTMAAYLKEKQVPETDVIIDSLGINTMATAINTAAIMKEYHFASAVVVTQYFHIPRSELSFHMVGIRNFSGDYPWYFEWRDIPSTLREMIAIPVYWLTREI